MRQGFDEIKCPRAFSFPVQVIDLRLHQDCSPEQAAPFLPPGKALLAH
jgi:hypothetical protein